MTISMTPLLKSVISCRGGCLASAASKAAKAMEVSGAGEPPFLKKVPVA